MQSFIVVGCLLLWKKMLSNGTKSNYHFKQFSLLLHFFKKRKLSNNFSFLAFLFYNDILWKIQVQIIFNQNILFKCIFYPRKACMTRFCFCTVESKSGISSTIWWRTCLWSLTWILLSANLHMRRLIHTLPPGFGAFISVS